MWVSISIEFFLDFIVILLLLLLLLLLVVVVVALPSREGSVFIDVGLSVSNVTEKVMDGFL